MFDENALFIPERLKTDRSYSILHNISAIELVETDKDKAKLGAVMQLPSGTRVEVCGRGFNDRTVKIRSNDRYYFVFWQDLTAVSS
jgi:hypothetical protein